MKSSHRTGDPVTYRQHIIGTFEIAGRSGGVAVVAPVVSVEGFAAYRWVAVLLYDQLAEGGTDRLMTFEGRCAASAYTTSISSVRRCRAVAHDCGWQA
ncbi:MAG: hypothetical protein E6J90_50850 [Deltaproteobacteria bacterium]|nr:MAG: hypothetical protein E6J90_50850 [Deltaproteobacteria bacterium]